MSFATAHQPPGQPQSKALPTAKLSTAVPTTVTHDTVVHSATVDNGRARSTKHVRESAASDATSLPATFALVQRILAPDHGIKSENPNPNLNQNQIVPTTIEQILPPLTSSNDVDLQLYAILAIVVKDFVNTWYSKITPDQSFIEEIIHIFAHCSRALEQRLRRVDITSLLLDEIPLLLSTHIDGQQERSSFNSSCRLTPR